MSTLLKSIIIIVLVSFVGVESGRHSASPSPAGRARTSSIFYSYPPYTLGAEGYIAQSDLIVSGTVDPVPVERSLVNPGTPDGVSSPFAIYNITVTGVLWTNSGMTPAVGGMIQLAVPAVHAGSGLNTAYNVAGGESLFVLRKFRDDGEAYIAHRGAQGIIPLVGSAQLHHEAFGSGTSAEFISKVRMLAASATPLRLPDEVSSVPESPASTPDGGSDALGPIIKTSEQGGVITITVAPRAGIGFVPDSALTVGGRAFLRMKAVPSQTAKARVFEYPSAIGLRNLSVVAFKRY